MQQVGKRSPEVHIKMQVLEAIAGIRGLSNTYALAETLYRVTDALFWPQAVSGEDKAQQHVR